MAFVDGGGVLTSGVAFKRGFTVGGSHMHSQVVCQHRLIMGGDS